MPHSGGGHGGGGGGFHSSSGGHISSTPKFDHFGNPHSRHYIRPGFYYYGMYIPRHRRGRRHTIISSLITLVAITLIGTLIILTTVQESKDPNRNLETYALERYPDVYNEFDKTYEYNILIVISAYEDNDEYGYWPVVGDKVDYSVDLKFGNEDTLFGHEVAKNIDSEGYYSTLYTNLAKSLEVVNDSISYKYYEFNKNACQIINNTEFGEIEGYDELKTQCDNFYNLTGYSISFSIEDANNIKSQNSHLFIICAIIAIIFIVSLISLGIKLIGMKKIDKAVKEGKEEKYFEGEDTYEKFKEDEYKLDPKDYDLTDEFK